MSSTSSILRAARPAFRQAFASRPAAQGQRFNQQFFRQNNSKRWQSTTSDAAGQSWFKRAWESEVGVKTVHFWAPVMKWALVLAGISDFARPAEKLSFTQNFALTCTGIIWTRWCLIIKPKNYLLAAVNFFLGLVGITQLTRITMHNSAEKKKAAEAIENPTPTTA
ncbi:Mitochondrial pyruvate carrier 3 [Cladobotryum mycophilum]|uniref:Mitochondrial pyruvate carrier n=1 Tax=Cladobotryum mycophilum TaxID=491253 RepID=A0ABR0SFV8_9HYPO